MKGFWEEKPHHVVRHRGPNGSTFKQMGPTKRLKISSLNSHLICVLCSGYYVEATTIVECLHTFCRSCIVKYLQTNHFCPICDVQLHQAKTWSSLRPDKILQDLVYKLVPGLYQDEMKRRRHFYSRLGEGVDVGEGEEGGFLPHGARFFSQDDSISLSLEYYSGQEEFEDLNVLNKKFKQINEKHKRYLQCPAAVTIRHLKKFLRMKYGIGLDCWVDIIYNDECLPENFTLIDVAYTFAWKRTSPMRFSYRMFRKVGAKAVKPEKNFQISRLDEGEDKKPKHQPTLEQQMQNEYLGNFNLNPTNSSFCKSQNCNKNINSCNSSDNAAKPNSIFDERKDDHCFMNCAFVDEGSREKLFPSSEDSSASGLKIISEKEESLRGNSEDSQESFHSDEKKRKPDTSVPNFGEEAVDSFTAKKLLKNKHKLEERKKKSGENHVEKRRKSASHIEDYEKIRKKSSVTKRRKTVADEFSLQRENEKRNLNDDEEIEVLGNLKNEALRKVFVSKEKPENSSKRKEEEIRKKKRKKSRHHEDESKKRKLEVIPTSPSILSFAKDPLKLKVKLAPTKTLHKSAIKRSEHSSSRETEGNSHKSLSKLGVGDSKRIITDKERLLHLRAVRHKNILKKHNLKDYINAPPSLTISKVSSSDHKSVKSTFVETKPSLEIVLVSSPNNSKTKTDGSSESRKEAEPKKKEIPVNEVKHSALVDNFGVLDLSEKSTRTKESSFSSECSKKKPENVERARKTPHQSIMQIAQNLVNRKLSPVLPKNNSKSGFDDRADPLAAAAAMRNLKTLSDTAVNILMASQNKNYPPEPRKRLFPSLSVPPPKVVTPPNSTKSSKDCENGSGLKIPVFPISRDRMHPIPPVPNLHEIYPRGRGKPVPASRPSTPIIKPGQNQTVRQIPNPFNVLNRQGNQNQNLVKPPSPSSPPPSPQLRPESNEEVNSKPGLDSIPPLQSIKTKTLVPKSDDLAELSSDKNPNDMKSMLMPKIVNNINNINNNSSNHNNNHNSNHSNHNNHNNNNTNSNNNNTKTVQNGSECNLFGLKNGEERKSVIKLNGSSNPVRKAENMAKNIESVAAGLTARAVSNAMIDAK